MTAEAEPTSAVTCPFWRKPDGGETHVCLARQGDPIVINARYVAAFCAQADHVRCSLFLRADRQEPAPMAFPSGSAGVPGSLHAERRKASGAGESAGALRLTAPRITAPPNHARLHSTTIVVGGTAQPGSNVLVFEGQEEMGRAVAAGSGYWEVTLGGTTPGEHRVYARCSDGAGRLSARSNLRALEVEADEDEELDPEVIPPQPAGKKAPFRSVERTAEARVAVRKPVDPAATVRLAGMPAVLPAAPAAGGEPAAELPPAAVGEVVLPDPQLSPSRDETAGPIASSLPAEQPDEVVLPATPSGGEDAPRPVAAPFQAAEVIPAEPPRRVEPVVDLIPVERVPHPRVAEVVPLVPNEPPATDPPPAQTDDRQPNGEAAQAERASERGEQTGEALQALAAYLRTMEGEPAAGPVPPAEAGLAPDAPVTPLGAVESPIAAREEPPAKEPQRNVGAGETSLASATPTATRVPESAPRSPRETAGTDLPGASTPVPSSTRRPRMKLLAGVVAALLIIVVVVAIIVLLRRHPGSQAVAARTRSPVVLSGVPTPTAPAFAPRAGSAPARDWHFAAVHGQLDEAVLLISNASTGPAKVAVTLSGAGGQETHVVNVPASNAVEMELMPPTATDAISLQASAPVLSQRLLTHHGVVHAAPGQPVPPTVTH